MEIEKRNFAPPGFPFAGKVFVIESLAEGRFVSATSPSAEVTALAGQITQECHFQVIRLPSGEVKLFSNYVKSFLSGVGAGWVLHAEVGDETWSRFKLDYDSSLGAFTLQSTQEIAKNGSYVSVVSSKKHLRIAEATPRDRWSYFRPYTLEGVPALNLDEWIP